jgi:hypothetical protein
VEWQHAGVPLRSSKASSEWCEEFLYTLKAGQRAAACGGRPRAGDDTTATVAPASPFTSADGTTRPDEVMLSGRG